MFVGWGGDPREVGACAARRVWEAVATGAAATAAGKVGATGVAETAAALAATMVAAGEGTTPCSPSPMLP